MSAIPGAVGVMTTLLEVVVLPVMLLLLFVGVVVPADVRLSVVVLLSNAVLLSEAVLPSPVLVAVMVLGPV